MRAALLFALCASTGCVAGSNPSIGAPLDEAATVCAAGATVTGIDVSHYQSSVDWAKVAASGRKFGIAKATEGTGIVDASFTANWSGMKSAGVMRAAYHFFRSNLDAAAQAQYYVKAVGALGAGDLPPMLDLETTDGQSAATVASKALTWLQTVEQLTGKKPIIYTYPDFWQNQIGAPSGFTGYPLNIANYGVTCPNVVGAWSTWTMWQNSSTGTVSGVSGQVDEDVFNGDEAALMNFASGGAGGGMPNPCIGLVDGSYCGGDGLAGDKNTLYVCKGGAVASSMVCAGGCKYNPPGTPDACNPAPPMPDGGATGGGGGGSGGGGGGGGGGSGDTGGGVGGGGSGAMGMPASGGCSFAGSSATSNGVALIALLYAAYLALRRRLHSV